MNAWVGATIYIALGLLAAPYLLYPLGLWLRASCFPRPVRSGEGELPTVDLVICAHNEAAAIESRMRNVLALNYPPELLRVWVASDGSDDDTVRIAGAYADERIGVLDLPRGGKAAALNHAVAQGQAEIIAFSDANSAWEPDALRALVAPLADVGVGGVAGNQRYAKLRGSDVAARTAGERGYWSYDRQLKRWQTLAGSVVSATGAIYAIRRDLFQPAPPDATDDFMVSTAVVAHGRRLVFASDAVAVEPAATSTGAEYRRKVRIITRGLRGVIYRRALLNPLRHGWYAVDLFLHKCLRRLAWLPLVWLALVTPACAYRDPLCLLIATGLWAGLLLAGLGSLVPSLGKHRVVNVAQFVVMVNAACAAATFNALRGRRVSHWSSGRTAGGKPSS